MKKIVASIMALLMVCSSQTSALSSKSRVKKVVSNVCTKVLPAAAVTLGVGILVKKLAFDNRNNVTTIAQPELASNKTNSCVKSNKSENVVIHEREAYEDGIRYIKWHGCMCWFNASILYLYYNDYYRDFLCNLKEDTYKEDDEFYKKTTIELARLVKKIKNSPTCMCELTEEDYNRVLSLHNNSEMKYGREGSEMVFPFADAIKYYNSGISPSAEQTAGRSVSVVYGNHHYYNWYYSKKNNRLYSIGESTDEHFENSVKVIKPGARKDKFLEQLTAQPIVLNT